MEKYCAVNMEKLFLLLSRQDEISKSNSTLSKNALHSVNDFNDNSAKGHQNLAFTISEKMLYSREKAAPIHREVMPGKEVYTQIEPELELNSSPKNMVTYGNNKINSIRRIGVLCNKNRLRLFRRVSELMITMLLPALEVALFCLCMGRDPTNIQMAVNNQEFPAFLSNLFLQSIDSNFISLKYFPTSQSALQSVRDAETYSAMIISANFSRALRNLYRFAEIDNKTADESTIKIYYDASNALHVNIIRREVFGAVVKFAENVAYSLGEDLSRQESLCQLFVIYSAQLLLILF